MTICTLPLDCTIIKLNEETKPTQDMSVTLMLFISRKVLSKHSSVATEKENGIDFLKNETMPLEDFPIIIPSITKAGWTRIFLL